MFYSIKKKSFSRKLLLLATALAAISSTSALAKTKSAKKPKLPETHLAFDQGSTLFFDKSSRISAATDCFPIHITQSGDVGVFYQYCPESAAAADYQSVKVSDNFTVPEALAPRFNFWRRVYSLWSKDTYVLHSAEYPEIVLEVGDFSRITAGDKTKSKIAKDFFKQRRRDYAKILVSMHHHRKDDPNTLPPTMRRIAKLMERITDHDKYLKVANNLRVQRGQRDFIAEGFGNASKYLPAIEKEFISVGVPVELSRIAFIESSFNLKAESKVGASGVFQIMPATGRQYRLKITDYIDERNDPVKAARAAAKLLALNYKISGSWPLAITGYNHGVNGIMRASRKAGSRDIGYLVKNHSGGAFGFASKNFYSGYLAILATLKQGDKIFPKVTTYAPLQFHSVRLPKSMNLAEVRKLHRVTNEEIFTYNHDISRRIVRAGGYLPAGYVLKIPDRNPKTEVAFSSVIK
jgi:membrane-bound lytic murein transglycosylase D